MMAQTWERVPDRSLSVIDSQANPGIYWVKNNVIVGILC